MALDDNDIILNALITAGVQINPDDAAILKAKLADIGDALGNSGLDSLKTISAELVRMRAGLEGDFNRLNDAAKRGLTADGMNKAELASLTSAFNRAKTYQDQLKAMVADLNKLGKTPLGGSFDPTGPNKPPVTTPLFNELAALNAQFARLAATMGAVSPLIDKVSLERKANKAREAKELQQSRQREANELRRQASERDRELREQATPVSKRAFYRGAKDNFQLTSKDDALEAKKFGQAELARTRALREMAINDYGKDDPRSLKASQVADTVSRVMGTLDERLADLKVSEPKNKKQKAADDRIRKLETDLQTSREVRNRQQRTGRDALHAAGGLEGDVSGFTKSADAAKALKFLNAELSDSKTLLKALRNEFDDSDPRVKRLGASVARTANYVDNLTNRTDELRKSEADYQSLQAEAHQTNKKFDADKLKAQKDLETEAHAINKKVDQERRDLETEARAEDKKFDDAKRQEQKKLDTLASKQTGLKVDRESRNETLRSGRLALEGVDGNVAKIDDFKKAQDAAKFLSGELRDARAERTALSQAFKDGSPEEVAATARITRLSKQYGDLQDHISALAAAKQEDNDAETTAKRIDDVKRRRATTRASDTESYRLLDLGKADPAQLTTLKEVRQAIKAGNTDLQEMQSIQKALANSTDKTSDQYRELTAQIEAAAVAMNGMRMRQTQLQAEADALKGGAGDRPPSQRSQIYEDGRNTYKSNLHEGGLEGLKGEDREQARSYASEKLTESRRSFDALQRSGTASAEEIQKASAAVREYEANLRRLKGSAAGAAGSMDYLTNVFKMFLKYAVVYQGLYQVAAAFSAVGRSVVDLQAEMLEIQAVTGSTTGEMQTLGNAVSAVASGSKFALLDLTKAAKVLAQAGIPVAEINSALQATANFAAATGTNLETASDLISTTRSVFKELNDDVIANQLAKAINVSKLTGEDLKTILSLGAQTARDFNLTSEQFLGAVATLRNAGLKASTTATGLRQAMLELFSPNDELAKALRGRYRAMGEDVGLEFVRSRFQAFAKGRAPMVAALTELKRIGFSDEAQGELSRAFDVRSQNAIKAMIDNLDQLSENEAKITFGRAAAEGAKTVVDGLSASFTGLYSTINSFSYNNSTGLLGFLTTAVQKLDEAIQKQARLNNLRDATAGLSGDEKEKSAFNPDAPTGQFSTLQRYGTKAASVVGNFIADEYRMLLPDLFDQRPEDVQNADTRSRGSSGALQTNQQRADELNLAAAAFDTKAAGPGTAAEAMLNASRELKDLTFALEKTFGAGRDPQEVQAEIKSYTNLSGTQRTERLATLQAKYPDTLGQRDPLDADKQLSHLQEQADMVNGAYRGFISGFQDKLVKANAVFAKLGDKPAENTSDLEAQVYQRVLSQDSTLLSVISGRADIGMQAQLDAMVAGSQKLADELHGEAAGGPLNQLAKQYAEDTVNKITKISLTTTRDKAAGDVDLAVAGLLAAHKGLEKSTVDRLNEIRGLINKAASENSGALGDMLTEVGTKLGQGIQDRQDKADAEGQTRVNMAKEELSKEIVKPDFAAYVKTQPNDTLGLDTVKKAMADPASIDWDTEFRTNSETAKQLTKYYEDYRDNFKVTLGIQRKMKSELATQRGQQEASRAATEKFNTANQSKKFNAAKGALGEMTAADLTVANNELKAAEEEFGNIKNNDPSKNNQIKSRIASAQARVDEIKERHAKELARITREQTKFDLASRKSTATNDRAEALGILKNADGNTPPAAIDAARLKFNNATSELLKILEESRNADGELNKLTDAQIEAEKQKLVMFDDSTEALALAYRKEGTIRDAINEQLARQLTTGNRMKDATYREYGLEPGTRAERIKYNTNRGGLLTAQIANATAANARDADQYQKNDVLIKAGKGTDSMVADQRTLTAQMRQRRNDVDGWSVELGDLERKTLNATSTIGSAMRDAFDTDMIRVGLQQSESGIEHLAKKIHDTLITGIEGVGDAFADSLLEGENFFDSLNDLLVDTGKDILRDVIKTYTTETISGALGMMTPAGREDSKNTPNATGGGLIGLAKSGYDWLMGNDPAAKGAPGPAAAVSEGKNVFGLGASILDGSATGVAGAMGCCCGESGLGGTAKKAGDLLGGKDSVLGEVADTEGKGFFDSVSDGFFGLIDSLKGGFGDMLGGLGKLAGIGGEGGAFGLLASLFKTGGMIRAATGGIITGPGTGTSDSVPGFIRSKTGKLKPLLTSNGESILNAKATSFLGHEGVHALNSGQYVTADTTGISNDISKMMAGTKPNPSGGKRGGESRIIQESRTTQLAVTPAQMRMKMGDWLEQHVLDEQAKR